MRISFVQLLSAPAQLFSNPRNSEGLRWLVGCLETYIKRISALTSDSFKKCIDNRRCCDLMLNFIVAFNGCNSHQMLPN